jgi:hypothetical protein
MDFILFLILFFGGVFIAGIAFWVFAVLFFIAGPPEVQDAFDVEIKGNSNNAKR